MFFSRKGKQSLLPEEGLREQRMNNIQNISHKKKTKNDFKIHGLLEFSVRHVVHRCDLKDPYSANVIWRKFSSLLGLAKQVFNSFILELSTFHLALSDSPSIIIIKCFPPNHHKTHSHTTYTLFPPSARKVSASCYPTNTDKT